MVALTAASLRAGSVTHRSPGCRAEMTEFSAGAPESAEAWHTLRVDEVARRVHAEAERGLSGAEVVRSSSGMAPTS